jgi:NarL family two-component system response regulator LiaR
MNQISVLVVDDHPLMRQALCALLEDEADITVVAEAVNGAEAVTKALALRPDVTIMDLLIPVKDGVEAIRAICEDQPGQRILAFSSASEDSRVLAAIQAGAMGYLGKDAQPAEILNAVRAVANGEHSIDREVMFKILQKSSLPTGFAGPPPAARKDDLWSKLTRREKEILNLIADGLSNRAIAQHLFLSEATVRSHLYHLLNKLGLEDRSQAIVFALRAR